jgi:hypothetical protein
MELLLHSCKVLFVLKKINVVMVFLNQNINSPLTDTWR